MNGGYLRRRCRCAFGPDEVDGGGTALGGKASTRSVRIAAACSIPTAEDTSSEGSHSPASSDTRVTLPFVAVIFSTSSCAPCGVTCAHGYQRA